MNKLLNGVEEYLAVRRALGFKLHEEGRLLNGFVDFLEKEGSTVITPDLALQWAMRPTRCQPVRWSKRLSVVRQFAQYRSAEDPRTEVPPLGLLPHSYHRPAPYMYSDEEIARLIGAAKLLPSPLGLRGETYRTFFGLIVVTGMRHSEARQLDRDDVDLTDGILTVRVTKFGKSRLVPLHTSTRDALRRYATLRDRIIPKPKSPSFFLSERGAGLNRWTVYSTFDKLKRQAGLQSSQGRRSPRIHDLRHRFATQTLLRLYRSGQEVGPHIAVLATYLGHADIASTYWYLSAVPELLSLVAGRLDGEHGSIL
jgi:integrase/recombinase XerD